MNEDQSTGMRIRTQRRCGFTLVEMVLVVGIVAILLSLLLPALRTTRDAARRVQCRNNLMQLGIAMFNYEGATGVFPPGVVNPPGPIFNEAEGYHMSWTVQLLASMEQSLLHDSTDFRVGVYSAENAKLASTRIATLLCPLSGAQQTGGVLASSYAACTGGSDVPITKSNDGMFFLNSSMSSKHFRDGAGNTIMLGERRPGSVPNGVELGWPSGTGSTLRNTGIPINSGGGKVTFGEQGDGTGGFGSEHVGGAMFLFGDGSVTFLNEDIDAATLRSLGTRDGGEGMGNLPFRYDQGF